MSVGLSRRIAEHVATVRFEDLGAAVVLATKCSLLDALGVMMAATTLGEGTQAFASLAVSSGSGPCTLIGRAGRTSPSMAALANGALAHAVDFEDSHDQAPVHPNAIQIPATLALAQMRGDVSGRELLVALAVGCDLACRLGLCLTQDPARRGWYPPPILGGLGAVAACARLARLGPAQILDAFSLALCASTCSGEIKYSPDSHLRAVRDAFPAQAALQAVLLAAQGVTGFAAPLEGRAGFFAMYADGGYDPEVLLAAFGRRFEGERLTFKPWPSCRGTHAFIEAALALREAEPKLAERVVDIALRGPPVLTMLDEPKETKRAPTTAIDAKFSLAFTVATALNSGAVTLDSFSPAALANPQTLALAARTRFAVDPAGSPGSLASGGTRLKLDDGRVLERYVSHPLGSPQSPMGEAALIAKFRDCAARAEVPLSAAELDRLIDAVLWLEHAANAAEALFPTA